VGGAASGGSIWEKSKLGSLSDKSGRRFCREGGRLSKGRAIVERTGGT
jgi:hypothetical protein